MNVTAWIALAGVLGGLSGVLVYRAFAAAPSLLVQIAIAYFFVSVLVVGGIVWVGFSELERGVPWTGLWAFLTAVFTGVAVLFAKGIGDRQNEINGDLKKIEKSRRDEETTPDLRMDIRYTEPHQWSILLANVCRQTLHIQFMIHRKNANGGYYTQIYPQFRFVLWPANPVQQFELDTSQTLGRLATLYPESPGLFVEPMDPQEVEFSACLLDSSGLTKGRWHALRTTAGVNVWLTHWEPDYVHVLDEYIRTGSLRHLSDDGVRNLA